MPNMCGRKLVEATFLPIWSYYGNITCTCMVEKQLWKSLDCVQHSVLIFITNARDQTHHWDLYQMTDCPEHSVPRQIDLSIFVYKAILKAWNTTHDVIFTFILIYWRNLNSGIQHLVTALHHHGEPNLKKFSLNINPVPHIQCGIGVSLIYQN